VAVRTRKPKLRVTTGYVVEDFSTAQSGYGSLTDKSLTRGQAIRHFCWSCQGGHEFDWRLSDGSVEKKNRPYEEVKACSATTCYLFPFRTGRDASLKPSVKPSTSTPSVVSSTNAGT